MVIAEAMPCAAKRYWQVKNKNMGKDYKEIMYSAFKAINKMEIEQSKKIGMLTYLFSIEPNCWRVTGISIDALKVFQKNDFHLKLNLI